MVQKTPKKSSYPTKLTDQTRRALLRNGQEICDNTGEIHTLDRKIT